MSTIKTINILEVAGGAVAEQIGIELAKVMENLRDPNTKLEAPRTLEIRLTFKNADINRETVNLSAQAKAKLVPNQPIGSMLYTQDTRDGVMAVEYMKPGHDPGQVSIDEAQGTDTTNVIQMNRRQG